MKGQARITILPEAVGDLSRLDDFLRDANPRAANEFLQRIEKAFDQLERFPLLGRILPRHRGFRELPIPFGIGAYVIRYRVDRSQVVVVRIWHSREWRE